MASMLRPLRVCACDRQKRKRLRNRCFATATDINGCSVARTIEVTMVGTARSIEITKISYHGGSSPEYSTDVFLCYQRLRVSCALCNNFQAARPRQTERRLAPLYVEHMPSILYIIYYISIRTTSDKVRMRQMFHVKHGIDAPPTTCMRSPKKKKAQKSMLRHSYRYQRVFSR